MTVDLARLAAWLRCPVALPTWSRSTADARLRQRASPRRQQARLRLAARRRHEARRRHRRRCWTRATLVLESGAYAPIAAARRRPLPGWSSGIVDAGAGTGYYLRAALGAAGASLGPRHGPLPERRRARRAVVGAHRRAGRGHLAPAARARRARPTRCSTSSRRATCPSSTASCAPGGTLPSWSSRRADHLGELRADGSDARRPGRQGGATSSCAAEPLYALHEPRIRRVRPSAHGRPRERSGGHGPVRAPRAPRPRLPRRRGRDPRLRRRVAPTSRARDAAPASARRRSPTAHRAGPRHAARRRRSGCRPGSREAPTATARRRRRREAASRGKRPSRADVRGLAGEVAAVVLVDPADDGRRARRPTPMKQIQMPTARPRMTRRGAERRGASGHQLHGLK